MIRVLYVGPFAQGVEIPMPDGTEPHVAHGEYLEVPDDVGARLLEQPSNWQPAEPAPTPQAPVEVVALTPVTPLAPAPEPDPAPAEEPTEPAPDAPAETQES